MKILMVSPMAYPPCIGGVEIHVWEISRKLIERGHDVEIYTTDPSRKLNELSEIDGLKIRRFPSFAPNGIYFFSMDLYKSLKNVRADIVHSHGFRAFPMLASALAKRWNKIPLVITLHLGFSKVGRFPYLLYNPFFGSMIFRRADRIIIVSPIETRLIKELEKVKNIVLIPNGVDISKVSSYLKVKKTEVDNVSPLRFLYVGRLERKKGIHYLIRAFQRISHMDVELVIVGEGPQKSTIDDLIRKLKLCNKVRLMGTLQQDKLYRIYTQSHIFILLSDFEAHSIALTEAMAFGLVPVVTNVGGNKYLVHDGLNGFLVKHPVDVHEVSNVLLKLTVDHNLLLTMSKRALKDGQLLNIDKTVNDLEVLYQSLGEV